MVTLNPIFIRKARRVIARKADALLGQFFSLDKTVEAMCLRPFELHLELTNLCNANCVFCPYQYQQRDTQTMSDEVFHKAVGDYAAIGGGAVGLTPVVGDALIDPKFLDRVRYLRSLPQVDRIWLTTNAILLDRFGVDNVLDSGVTSINISTAGFDREMYERVYRNGSYHRMQRNVLELVQRNTAKGRPVSVAICLRPDRPLSEVMKHPDFQPILAHSPELDFTWSYTNANGRIKRDSLPALMKIRTVSSAKNETCVQLLNGPIVLSNGEILCCSCVASMDSAHDLGIGNILRDDLLEAWTSERLRQIRAAFQNGKLSATCGGCDMYRDLELYRTSEGRERARLNLARHRGELVRRQAAAGPFSGG
ncbi:MAG: radical SAM protein [Bryobacteraceae bacterium]|jgi:MoaA/NifB/PqqE/SkfB family radical SAM enzyme